MTSFNKNINIKININFKKKRIYKSFYFFWKIFKVGYFYDSKRAICTKKSVFGQYCDKTSQCDVGLVCSSKGGLKNICLKDYGQLCGSSNECINLLGCIESYCSCPV